MDERQDKIKFESDDLPINFFAKKKLYATDLPFCSRLTWHDEFEIKHITDGEATFQIGTDVIDVKKGDVVICNSKELHCIKKIPSFVEYNIAVFNLGFFSDNFGRLESVRHIKPLLNGEIRFIRLIRDDESVSFAIERLFSILLNDTENRALSVTGLLLYLFSLLFDSWIDKIYDCKGENQDKLKKLRPCIEFINKNYNSNGLSLDCIAKKVFLSPIYLSKIFKDVLGINFKDYLTAVRLSNAEKLLLSTDEKVSQISKMVGIEDPCYFNRWFKKNTGVTPSEYRNKKH